MSALPRPLHRLQCNGSVAGLPARRLVQRAHERGPSALGEWPGLPGAPVTGPSGDHRVVFDDHGIFAAVATLYTDDPDGTRLIWCYPMHDSGAREVGATAEGNSGVDEAWRDE
ncbi:hypothetical protein K449DRAFT_446617 [Hypoxylon sp. EC38]|nr:hypothetical protein K449DRAFT_446617 [Hypoxylon sp. EC38]